MRCGAEAFATVSRASDRARSAPNKAARKLIASFRIAANCGNAMQTRISAPKRPVELGLRDPFLRVIGDIEQFRALKLRKSQLIAASQVNAAAKPLKDIK